MGKQDIIIERVTLLMGQNNLSSYAFARKVGLDPSNFAKKIKGSIPFTKKDITTISSILKVSSEWILGGDECEPYKYQEDYSIKSKKHNTAQRLLLYLKNKGIAPYNAEKECGLSNGLISKAAKTGSSLRCDNLEKILNTYQDLSAEWLLRGIGNMLTTDGIQPEQVFKTLNMPPNSDKIIEVWKQFMDCTRGMQDLYRQANNTESVQNPCDHDDTQPDKTDNE